jgi:hypothetical protein
MKQYRVKPSLAPTSSMVVGGHPRRSQSHVDLINEEIDLFEGQGDSEIERLYRKHESLQALLPTIGLDDHKRYEQTLEKIRLVRAEIIKLESL